jgi:hypothetical protein
MEETGTRHSHIREAEIGGATMHKEFRATLILSIKVPCEEGMSTDVLRDLARVKVNEIRGDLPRDVDSWLDGYPQTIEEVLGKNPIDIDDIVNKKIERYRTYLNCLDPEGLDYEFSDRGQDDGISRVTETKIRMLVDWLEAELNNDPFYKPEMEYK